MTIYRVPPEPPARVPAIVVFVCGVFAAWTWAIVLSAVFPS